MSNTLISTLTAHRDTAVARAAGNRKALGQSYLSHSPSFLIDTATDLAVAEAVTQVYATAVSVAENYDAAAVVGYALDHAFAAVDDTWSGRGNDVRRTVHAARTEAFAAVHRAAVRAVESATV